MRLFLYWYMEVVQNIVLVQVLVGVHEIVLVLVHGGGTLDCTSTGT